MLSPKRPASAIERPVAKQCKCGVCGLLGHNRRKCPAVPAAAAAPVVDGQVNGPNFENGVEEADSPPPPVPTANDNASYIDWDNVLYVVSDLETTGRSRHKIIELAAVILDCLGVEIEDAFFSEFVKPTEPIPPFITELTSITNNDVSTAESFAIVGDAFIGFIQEHANELGGMVEHIILVGHNGKVFDIPFFIHQMGVHRIEQRLIED
jgi:DNA polymerase III epsilon subunit-like protein